MPNFFCYNSRKSKLIDFYQIYLFSFPTTHTDWVHVRIPTDAQTGDAHRMAKQIGSVHPLRKKGRVDYKKYMPKFFLLHSRKSKLIDYHLIYLFFVCVRSAPIGELTEHAYYLMRGLR